MTELKRKLLDPVSEPQGLRSSGKLGSKNQLPLCQAMAARRNRLQKPLCIFPLKTQFLGGFHSSSLGHMPALGLREGREP